MIKKVTEGIRYQKLTEAEMKQRGILGRLIGPCADFNNATRNGRKYSEQLWENVFNNPIMQEKIKNKVCYGELGHPEDRAEIDPEKIAVCLSEQPVKNKNGQLEAVFDILDTPNGRILKTLCDYGSTLGVSSRGQGDIITDYNGEEAVDPETYECECWDIVLIPAVKEARLKYVREGLDTRKAGLRKALTEAFNKENEEGKKVMAETLKDLNIDINENEPTIEEAKKDEEEGALLNPTPADDAIIDNTEEVVAEPEGEVATDELEVTEPFANDEAGEEAAVTEPVEGEEAAEDERTDEEIFLDYLVANFDEKQVKKACKALDIDIPEDEEEKDSEEDADKEDAKEAESKGEAEDKEDTKEDENSTDEKSDEDKEEEEDKVDEALDKGSVELVKNLQEALKGKLDLEALVKTLKEQLAVSDAKVNELKEQCNKYQSSITRLAGLAKSNKDLQKNVESLQESLNEKNQTISDQTKRIARLVEGRKKSISESSTLTESVNAKQKELETLNESVDNLKKDYEKKFTELREQVINESAEAKKKEAQLNESLNKANALKESYKKLANEAMNMLIEERATQLGLTAQDIKRKLGASYTIADVNTVCEELKRYQLNVSKLPFSIDRKVGVRVNEAVQRSAINKAASKGYDDDDVDDGLMRMANLY